MNQMFKSRPALIVALTFTVTTLILLVLVLPAMAEPGAQGLIPTPTLHPVDEVTYTLERVGGDGYTTRTFPGQEVDGVIFGDTTLESEYPDRLRFSLEIDPGDVVLDRVRLVVQHTNGALDPKTARENADNGTWGITWTVTDMPTWTPFNFAWCVRDTDGNDICTDYHRSEFWDPDIEWMRVENEAAILYWFGFGEDQPDAIARQFTQTVMAQRLQLMDGFGRYLSYKPIVVVYPDEDAYREVMPGQPFDWPENNFALYGVSANYLQLPDLVPTHTSCSLLPPEEERSVEWRLDLIFGGWGIPLLLQGDLMTFSGACTGSDGWACGNWASAAWDYGQARWFVSQTIWDREQRVRDLAAIEPFPSLLTYDEEFGADGCRVIYADVGASFVSWLIDTYGLETHRQIVNAMMPSEDVPRGVSFEDAIEQATGKSFAELENEWRAYLAMPPLE